VEPGEALESLLAAPRWIWPAVVGLFVVNSGLYVWRVDVLMAERLPFWAGLRAVLVANFAGIALPTGAAEAAKVLTLAEYIGGVDRSLATIVASRLVELVIWAGLLVWAAVFVLPGRLDVLVPVAWVFALGMLGAAGGGALVPRLAPGLVRRLPARAGGFLGRVTAAMALVGERPGGVLVCAALTVVFAACNCFTVWVILGAHGVSISYPDTLGLIPTLDIFLSLPLSPSGVGVREAVFLNALAPYGATAATALAVGYTRWWGHLGRAAIGGVLFVLGRRKRD
jgi:uncharacterized membrane protein YbhN (UPF0104 family)